MKRHALILAYLMLVPAVSMASTPGKNVVEKTQTGVSGSGSALRPAKSDKDFQRDREMLLRKKAALEGKVQPPAKASKKAAARALPTAKEKQIYEELVQAFDRNDELSFQSRFQAMMMDYAGGIYADEAVYLAGMMAFSNKMYGKALKYFDQVLKEYPRSNRSRSALYAKAATYRKMNLQAQSVSVFQQVQRRYPGSPEARRASMDLKAVTK